MCNPQTCLAVVRYKFNFFHLYDFVEESFKALISILASLNCIKMKRYVTHYWMNLNPVATILSKKTIMQFNWLFNFHICVWNLDTTVFSFFFLWTLFNIRYNLMNVTHIAISLNCQTWPECPYLKPQTEQLSLKSWHKPRWPERFEKKVQVNISISRYHLSEPTVPKKLKLILKIPFALKWKRSWCTCIENSRVRSHNGSLSLFTDIRWRFVSIRRDYGENYKVSRWSWVWQNIISN